MKPMQTIQNAQNAQKAQKAQTPGAVRQGGKVLKLVQLAILTALTLLLSLTPLGYLPVGAMKISFLMVPVVVGAIVVGPAGGAFLGLVFGLTSFSTCVTGTDALGAMLLSISPVGTFVMCVVPRILAGLLPGLFVLVSKNKIRSAVLYPLAAIFGSLLNTVFFLGAVFLIFGQNAAVIEALAAGDKTAIAYIFATIAGLNGTLEAITCCVVGAGLSGAINRLSVKR
jgi:uncharacterized membrane protein